MVNIVRVMRAARTANGLRARVWPLGDCAAVTDPATSRPAPRRHNTRSGRPAARPTTSLQLKTDRTRAIASEHFDEGEQLVRQGDFGDKLFVIRSGRIERLHPLDECVQILEELIGDARGQLGAEPARQLVLVSHHHAAGPGGTPAAGG